MLTGCVAWLRARFVCMGEEGQDLAEYALLIALVALAVAVTIMALWEQMDGTFATIVDAFGRAFPG